MVDLKGILLLFFLNLGKSNQKSDSFESLDIDSGYII